MSGGEEPRIFRVAEVSRGLKQILEQRTAGLWVEGEIGGVQRPGSGHVYFTIKDELEEAALDCVLYKREAMRFGRAIEEGARVVLRGRATLYAPRGRLQWVCDVVRPSGRGALLVKLEELKRRLAEEGLFDPSRKRRLPTTPRVIGVVTSRTGAAFHDICTVALRRAHVRIVLSAATVQGEGAPLSIIQALDRLEALPELDVLIVGRGGGAQEDLLAFSDERVVRRLAATRVPVVSAVGHEIDHSLADLVADARAATPSQAAEMVVYDASERIQTLRSLERRVALALTARVRESAVKLTRLEKRLGDPRFVVATHRQHLDELSADMERWMRSILTEAKKNERELTTRLERRHPRAVVLHARSRLLPLYGRLRSQGERLVEQKSAPLGELAARLDALSPLKVLGRGYAVVLNRHGKAVRSASEVFPGERLSIRLKSGEIAADVVEPNES
ncbi:MAG: exodeoxyribonuclease VII large subunit [Sorangiineae bacterium NIC37A_2]|nr:MAG: exodeoxyribonuclease VII large subunit [Sorangiineae bacterium NIC37A_2]